MIRFPERVMEWISATPWMIDQAKARQILAFLDFRAQGGTRSDQEIRAIVKQKKLDTAATGSGIAVIPLFGVIAQRASSMDQSSGFASLEQFMTNFREAVNDDGIGTIVLQIDSPGGSVDGIAEATDEIFAARDKKRLIAVADPMACSAAYSLASACHEVVVGPSGVLGSVGVIAVHAEFSKAEEAGGIAVNVITAGRYKGEGNPHEPLSDTARGHIQEAVDDYYGLFVDAVARNRGATPDAVQKGYGQGRALTAKRAVKAQLADRVATLDEVLAELGVRRRMQSGSSAEAGAPDIAAHMVILPIAAGPGVALPVPTGIGLLALTTGTTVITGGDQPRDEKGKYVAAPDPNPGCDDEDEDDAPPDAPGDAAAARETSPSPAPTGQENHMAENANGSQNDPGAATQALVTTAREQESKRAADIAQLGVEHQMSDKVPGWIAAGMTPDAVGREILKEKSTANRATSPAPAEERRAPALITRRHSSREEEPGFKFGLIALGMAAACESRKNGGKGISASDWVASGGFPDIAASMRSDRLDQGGAWVPENYLAGEFIELLRPASAVRKLNPRFVGMTGGTATLPGLQGGATGYYKGEAKSGTATGATSKRITLVARELMVFVPLTAQLLRRAMPDAAAMVRDDAVAASATRSDLAFIRGDGTLDTPRGLRYQAAAANVITANGTVNLANVTTDLGLARLALLNSNVRMLNPGWLFAPRTEHYLMTVRDGNGNYAFRPEMLLGKLWGYPYATTTQIPTNLGGGTNESEVYIADFSDVVIGEEDAMQVDVFDQVTYYDGSNWQSSAQNNEVVLRVVENHDIGVRHPESVAVLTAVKWGA